MEFERGIFVKEGGSMGLGDAPRERIEGTVAWFKDQFGFIRRDDGSKDVFCHHSAIDMNGYKTLKEGQRVSFSVVRGSKGLQAEDVRVV